MESINKKDLIWVKLMSWGSEKWGCHQIPERSFFINGYQFPLCARCTGILCGALLGVMSTLIKKRISKKAAFSMVPLLVDGSLQFFSEYKSNNIKRLFTGLFFGFGAILTVLKFTKKIIERIFG